MMCYDSVSCIRGKIHLTIDICRFYEMIKLLLLRKAWIIMKRKREE